MMFATGKTLDLEGVVAPGLGEGSRFTQIGWVVDEFRRKLGFVPTGVTRPRMSCARGQEVMAHEYALDLDADAAPQMRAA